MVTTAIEREKTSPMAKIAVTVMRTYEHRCNQGVDYAQLELVERQRSPRPIAIEGAWAAIASSTVAEAPLLTPPHGARPRGVGAAALVTSMRSERVSTRGGPTNGGGRDEELLGIQVTLRGNHRGVEAVE